jgi:hypothetical protein
MVAVIPNTLTHTGRGMHHMSDKDGVITIQIRRIIGNTYEIVADDGRLIVRQNGAPDVDITDKFEVLVNDLIVRNTLAIMLEALHGDK